MSLLNIPNMPILSSLMPGARVPVTTTPASPIRPEFIEGRNVHTSISSSPSTLRQSPFKPPEGRQGERRLAPSIFAPSLSEAIKTMLGAYNAPEPLYLSAITSVPNLMETLTKIEKDKELVEKFRKAFPEVKLSATFDLFNSRKAKAAKKYLAGWMQETLAFANQLHGPRPNGRPEFYADENDAHYFKNLHKEYKRVDSFIHDLIWLATDPFDAKEFRERFGGRAADLSKKIDLSAIELELDDRFPKWLKDYLSGRPLFTHDARSEYARLFHKAATPEEIIKACGGLTPLKMAEQSLRFLKNDPEYFAKAFFYHASCNSTNDTLVKLLGYIVNPPSDNDVQDAHGLERLMGDVPGSTIKMPEVVEGVKKFLALAGNCLFSNAEPPPYRLEVSDVIVIYRVLKKVEPNLFDLLVKGISSVSSNRPTDDGLLMTTHAGIKALVKKMMKKNKLIAKITDADILKYFGHEEIMAHKAETVAVAKPPEVKTAPAVEPEAVARTIIAEPPPGAIEAQPEVIIEPKTAEAAPQAAAAEIKTTGIDADLEILPTVYELSTYEFYRRYIKRGQAAERRAALKALNIETLKEDLRKLGPGKVIKLIGEKECGDFNDRLLDGKARFTSVRDQFWRLVKRLSMEMGLLDEMQPPKDQFETDPQQVHELKRRLDDLIHHAINQIKMTNTTKRGDAKKSAIPLRLNRTDGKNLRIANLHLGISQNGDGPGYQWYDPYRSLELELAKSVIDAMLKHIQKSGTKDAILKLVVSDTGVIKVEFGLRPPDA